ncbi:methionine ABC transporter permease [Buchananella felis]|uniref:methionine ABC transporter permease n=1 Tax=Buchananella felis TaxID=3231492 RepID=UPI0035287F38
MNVLSVIAGLPGAVAQAGNGLAAQAGVALAGRDKSFFEELVSSPVIRKKLWPAVVETLQMTGLSTLVAVLVGLPLGIALVATASRGLRPNRVVNAVLSAIVNVGRSVPFIILLIALIPFTRWLVGDTLGWLPASVPLSIGAIPFFARLAESAILGVESGKIEAAQMMGATRLQIMWGVQVREALPTLIQQITVTAVTLVSYSAMAGTVGAGGLGNLAILYGYNRYNTPVMVAAIVVIVAIVQLIQWVGDMLSRWVDHR